MILAAGTFRVSEYRKEPSRGVYLAVIIQQEYKAPDGIPFTIDDALIGNVQIDHNPALLNRPYDTEAGDFIPPQHQLDKLVALRKGQHLQKTTGRKEGASSTVTTRGSDVGEAKRTRDIAANNAVHQATMASKAGDYEGAAQILATAPKPPRQKEKIKSRGFDKSHRPLRSRSSFERRT